MRRICIYGCLPRPLLTFSARAGIDYGPYQDESRLLGFLDGFGKGLH